MAASRSTVSGNRQESILEIGADGVLNTAEVDATALGRVVVVEDRVALPRPISDAQTRVNCCHWARKSPN